MKCYRMNLCLFQRKMLQTLDAIECFEKLFLEFKPKRILEIGAGRGALSLFLGIHAVIMDAKTISIDTWDKRKTGLLMEKLSLPSKFLCSDYKLIFDDCINFIHEDSPSLVLCDNGCKEEELFSFAPHLREGDILMAHDWKTEVRESFVDELVEKQNLEYFKQTELWDKLDSRWVCLRKLIIT